MIGDPWVVAAIVDRLTLNAHIAETGTETGRRAARFLCHSNVQRESHIPRVSLGRCRSRWFAAVRIMC